MSLTCFALELLWVAPELLRLVCVPPKGTQKGDIYSFSIILQEIVLRATPYENETLEPYGEIQCHVPSVVCAFIPAEYETIYMYRYMKNKTSTFLEYPVRNHEYMYFFFEFLQEDNFNL